MTENILKLIGAVFCLVIVFLIIAIWHEKK